MLKYKLSAKNSYDYDIVVIICVLANVYDCKSCYQSLIIVTYVQGDEVVHPKMLHQELTFS